MESQCRTWTATVDCPTLSLYQLLENISPNSGNLSRRESVEMSLPAQGPVGPPFHPPAGKSSGESPGIKKVLVVTARFFCYFDALSPLLE